MEKTKEYNPGHQLIERFYDILKEISEIRPQTTFTKEQEEEFLKDAIVIFEYLKSGIDIKSSEILINNGDLPFSCLEKILIKFSVNRVKDYIKTYTFHIYKSDEGKPVKIYEFQNCEKNNLEEISNILPERNLVSMKRNILFIKKIVSAKGDSITRLRLKKLIDYALKNGVIILYDATSNKENEDVDNVKSIYEIENAKKVAIEFRRFSSVDNDNITCGYLVVPDCLRFQREDYKEINFSEIKDMLQKEMQKENVSRKSLKKSFLKYACL